MSTDAKTSKKSIGRRRAIVVLAALSMLGGVVGYTMATFSAQTRNPGNVFASGTLVLSNQKNSNTTCFSTGGGTTDSNVNNSCDQLFNSTVQKPGDSGTVDITLKNEGSINASALSVYMAACATTDTAEAYHGTGNMCSQIQVYVQEYTSAARTTPNTCAYGGGTASTCAFSGTRTLATFAASYPVGTQLGLGATNAGVSRYYRIGLSFPSSSDNTFQGRQAGFDFTWVLSQ